MNQLPIGRPKLYWLIDLYLSGHHDVRTFCREFENTYNFEVKKLELTRDEEAAFSALFDKVVMYSNIEAELKTVPFYVSAAEIHAAATATKSVLAPT
ncbi:MAG: hypothetical protein K2X57_11405 [Xanthobacteraceae bacterium]|nr:hypothetical protein [Xanthobacteraceae bacterium]